MAKIVKVLDNASPGVGTAISVGAPFNSVSSNFTLQVTGTGLTTDMNAGVVLEGSLDGVSWGKLGGLYGSVGVNLKDVAAEQAVFGSTAAILDRTIEHGFLLDSVKFIRARFLVLEAGSSTNPKVTAYVCVRDLENVD